jgi:hypothetical protein
MDYFWKGRIRQASLICIEAVDISGDVVHAALTERKARSARIVKDRKALWTHDLCSYHEGTREEQCVEREAGVCMT